MKIDILIPAIEKDQKTLPLVIDGVRKNIMHPIGDIYIVAPDNKRIKYVCKKKECTFIDEKTVLPISKEIINYRTDKWDRSGWMLQQLLKLSGDVICSQNYFLVIDADTVLIRPHHFIREQKTIFFCRDWSHDQYFNTYETLLGYRAMAPRSFVAHYMLFEKELLYKLKNAIETKHDKSWYLAIIETISNRIKFAFSEFETYGNFVYKHYPDQLILEKSLNKACKRRRISRQYINKLSDHYMSVSFHNRKWYSINK
ncbi:DUF6492 family protein [Bacillus sp. Marseille-P3661]|uniref:DUF6492 family protein n=1 Tax=Bacillus sp. Marseille-P3661 TaxID=1936234 RepID=UPI002155C5A7|nr:DUF6492 family protein [Bacillus sp. Marseille-P3661]